MLNEDLVKGRPPKKTEIFMTDVARDYLGNKNILVLWVKMQLIMVIKISLSWFVV